MGNKNYLNGVRKERRIQKKYERMGWTVLRTAGSHGFTDLIAIKEGLIKFIQCKPDNFSKREEEKLMKEHEIYNKYLNWSTRFEVI